jgi:microsomal dipeptidase-like Zn-dependent dipeptidase
MQSSIFRRLIATKARRWLLAAFILVLLAALCIPPVVDAHFNKTLASLPYKASPRTIELHRSLWIADLHADSLLWGRNLLTKSTRGHVDVPRLIEGNVALQVFSVPTKTPWGLNIERNRADSDQIKWLAVVEHWPWSTWSDLTQRAVYQANRLQQMADASDGRFVIIRTAADLNNYVKLRQTSPNITAGILAIEGAHALKGDLANIEVLRDAGYRMMSPSHFFDNDIGGSSAGMSKIGLTEKGRSMIRQMEAERMIVDLSHASSQTIDDVLAIATRPVVVSHTGVRATCNNNRNLSDSQIVGVAKSGGLIGVGYWSTATCGNDAKAIARAMRHVSDLVGAEHVALGSDFDGAVEEPFDASGLIRITDELIAQGYSEDQIRMIMGENVLMFLRENLP